MLFSTLVLTCIDTAIGPRFFTIPMLKIVLPFALVLGSIHMDVSALAISLIVDPIAFVDIAVDVNEATLTMGSSVLPLAIVLRTIWPVTSAMSVAETSFPLARVLSTGLVRVSCPSLYNGFLVVLLLADCLSAILGRKVPGVGSFSFNQLGDFLAG